MSKEDNNPIIARYIARIWFGLVAFVGWHIFTYLFGDGVQGWWFSKKIFIFILCGTEGAF